MGKITDIKVRQIKSTGALEELVCNCGNVKFFLYVDDLAECCACGKTYSKEYREEVRPKK